MATVLAQPIRRAQPAKPAATFVSIAHARLILTLILFTLGVAVLALRMGYMGVVSGPAVRTDVSATPVPVRADIVDRNGVTMARNIDAYAIAVRPARLIRDPAELARRLHMIFPDTPVAEFETKLRGNGWAYLRRRALPEQVAAVNAIGEPGIEFPREKERLYPQRTLAAHVLGMAGADGHGIMGIERAMDARLTDPAKRGEPLVLSIDTRVQAALEGELASGVATHSALGGVGIVLDVRNGEVIAMANYPTFNPNRVIGGEAPNAKCDDSTVCNRAIQARYELGSTFKPLAVAAAMDAGVVTSMSKLYDATKPIQIGKARIRDDHALGRWINVPEALVHSSNIVTARIADEMGPAPLQQVYRALEFDQRPSIELRERQGTLWPRTWGRVENMTVAYGHGIAVTPLHLVSAYAALVNGGVWHPATLVKLPAGAEPQGRRVFTPATSARMRQLLRMIVMSGTGRNANAEGYRVGGKTGSAEKPRDGGYARRSLIATFAAAFPMEDPRYVVVVMMDEPKGSATHPGLRTAAWNAAPVVKAFIERAGPMLGVFPEAVRDVDIAELTPLLHGKGGE